MVIQLLKALESNFFCLHYIRIISSHFEPTNFEPNKNPLVLILCLLTNLISSLIVELVLHWIHIVTIK